MGEAVSNQTSKPISWSSFFPLLTEARLLACQLRVDVFVSYPVNCLVNGMLAQCDVLGELSTRLIESWFFLTIFRLNLNISKGPSYIIQRSLKLLIKRWVILRQSYLINWFQTGIARVTSFIQFLIGRWFQQRLVENIFRIRFIKPCWIWIMNTLF